MANLGRFRVMDLANGDPPKPKKKRFRKALAAAAMGGAIASGDPSIRRGMSSGMRAKRLKNEYLKSKASSDPPKPQSRKKKFAKFAAGAAVGAASPWNAIGLHYGNQIRQRKKKPLDRKTGPFVGGALAGASVVGLAPVVAPKTTEKVVKGLHAADARATKAIKKGIKKVAPAIRSFAKKRRISKYEKFWKAKGFTRAASKFIGTSRRIGHILSNEGG